MESVPPVAIRHYRHHVGALARPAAVHPDAYKLIACRFSFHCSFFLSFVVGYASAATIRARSKRTFFIGKECLSAVPPGRED
jgi:hypothetical protein